MIKPAKLVWGLFLALCWTTESSAFITFYADRATESISFSNASNFSGAQYHQAFAVTASGTFAGDSTIYTYSFAPGNVPSNFMVTGDSHIAVSNLILNATSTTNTVNLTNTDGQLGTFTPSFDRVANIGPNLSTSIIGGFNVLDHLFNSNISLTSGSSFSVSIEIAGDWSMSGSSSGNHMLLSINPLWTIDSNFIYSGGVTTVSAHIDSYVNDGLHTANLGIRLIGAPLTAAVPEPETYAMMLAGLGLLGCIKS